MPIVHYGGRIDLRLPRNAPHPGTGAAKVARLSLGKVGGTGRHIGIAASRKARVAQILDDLTVVQEHFGVSRSEALRLSLHLTANAIRKNRALPDVP